MFHLLMSWGRPIPTRLLQDETHTTTGLVTYEIKQLFGRPAPNFNVDVRAWGGELADFASSYMFHATLKFGARGLTIGHQGVA